MDGEFDSMQAKIREAINNGKVTKESVERGLKALIDEELSQTERPVNTQLVNSCLDILFTLNEKIYVSQKDASLRALKTKLNRKARINTLWRNLPRVAAVLVVLIVGGIGLDIVIEHEYLVASPTVDQQHYQIKGYIIDNSIVSEGLADSEDTNEILENISFEDIPSIIGFNPPYPHWLPSGWKPKEFNGSVSRFASTISIVYDNDQYSDSMRYTIMNYDDVSVAATEIEQSANGSTYQWDNNTVYLANNYDSLVAVWIIDNVYYTLSGPFDENQMKSIIESIKRRNE